jgi:hypothetical protein
VLSDLIQVLKLTERNSIAYLFILKRQYCCLVKMERIRDAEMVLYNIIEGSKKHEPEIRFQARLNLLIHYLNHLDLEANSSRLIELAESLLADADMKNISESHSSLAHLAIGISYFISEKKPYSECSDLLKQSLDFSENDGLKSIILHNLAIINYCHL